MPFAPTSTALLTNSTVTVKFAGLMVLKPGANNGCEIAIHRFTNTHTFQVILVVNKPNLPPTLIRLVTGPLTRDFTIEVRPDPNTGVQVFAPTPDPFVRTDTNNHLLDFRWSVNVRDIHPNAEINDGAKPVVKLTTGILYTPNLTRPNLGPILVQPTTTTPLVRLAAELAAAIDLNQGRTVELTWFELGKKQSFTLPRPAAVDPEGTTYTIALVNDPVFSTPGHEELDLYYRILEVGGKEIDQTDRCRIDFASSPSTDEIPCMPLILNP